MDEMTTKTIWEALPEDVSELRHLFDYESEAVWELSQYEIEDGEPTAKDIAKQCGKEIKLHILEFTSSSDAYIECVGGGLFVFEDGSVYSVAAEVHWQTLTQCKQHCEEGGEQGSRGFELPEAWTAQPEPDGSWLAKCQREALED